MKYEVARTVEGWISRKSLGLSSYSTKEQKDAKAKKVRAHVRVDKKGHETQNSSRCLCKHQAKELPGSSMGGCGGGDMYL